MKMKKIISLGAVVITMTAVLTGCSTKEDAVKSVRKEVDEARVDLQYNVENVGGSKSVEETSEKETSEKERSEKETPVKETNDGDKGSKNDIVVNVNYTQMIADDGVYYMVYGNNADNKAVWTYQTKKDVGESQFSTVEFIKYNETNGNVILNELGTINVLDAQTGKIKWSNNEGIGGMTNVVESQNNELFFYSIVDNTVLVVNENGKTIKKFNIRNKVSEEEDLPLAMNGISTMYLEDAKGSKLIVVYELTVDEDENGKTKETIFTKKMTIDIEKTNVQIDTIGKNVEML